jgi:hypothetical protein
VIWLSIADSICRVAERRVNANGPPFQRATATTQAAPPPGEPRHEYTVTIVLVLSACGLGDRGRGRHARGHRLLRIDLVQAGSPASGQAESGATPDSTSRHARHNGPPPGAYR